MSGESRMVRHPPLDPAATAVLVIDMINNQLSRDCLLGTLERNGMPTAYLSERVDRVVLVTDEEIEDAFRFLYARAKLACEPAGAASTAALLAGKVELEPGPRVVAVVSGGNTAPETASAILAPR